MKPKELFLIALKVFGIFLIKDVLFTVPEIIDFLTQIVSSPSDFAIRTMIITFLSIALQVSIVYLLLFKTSEIIDKLKLTSGFGEEALSFNLHRSSVYSIAVIVSGIMIIVLTLPKLLRQIYYWIEYIREKNQFYAGPPFEYVNLLTVLAEVIIGCIFLSKNQAIMNFVEIKRRKKSDL